MQFYLTALRAMPGDPCSPTEPCIPTDPCTPTDPCINERLLSALPLTLAERLGAPAPGPSMFTEGPGDPCAPTDPCIVSQPTDPCIDTQPGDPCIFTLPIASLGDGHELVALNPQPLPPNESSLIDEPSPEPQFAGVAMASEFDPGVDPVALNPQPLPPAEIGRDTLSPVALNPQPRPPAEIGRSALSLVALNPQPLPPQESRFLSGTVSIAASLNTGREIAMPDLQTLLSSRQQGLQLHSDLINALGGQAQAIASNVGK